MLGLNAAFCAGFVTLRLQVMVQGTQLLLDLLWNSSAAVREGPIDSVAVPAAAVPAVSTAMAPMAVAVVAMPADSLLSRDIPVISFDSVTPRLIGVSSPACGCFAHLNPRGGGKVDSPKCAPRVICRIEATRELGKGQGFVTAVRTTTGRC